MKKRLYRLVLAVAVPIVVAALVVAFIVTFAIVPKGHQASFAAKGDLHEVEDRYVRFIPAPKSSSAASRIEPEDRAIAKNGLLAVLGSGGPQGLSTLMGGAGLGGELEGAIGNTIGMGRLGTRGRGGGGGRYGYGTGVSRIRKRGERNVNISVGRPVIMGSLSMEIIRQVIHSHRDQIKYCYSKELTRNPNLSGKVAVKFTISPKGYVQQASISNTSLRNAAVERCMTQKIRTWKFPSPKSGGIVIVNYPFMLNSSGARIQPGGLVEREEEEPDEPSLERLGFIPARGYFENTYLSVGPALEWLRRRLERDISLDGKPLNLERAVVPYLQPFDPPVFDGLAVYMSADRTFVEEPARITLQVGLKGSGRHARRRACLNAALVVDLRWVSSEETRRILWSLADAMADDLQAGDRFHLVVAGVERPLRVKPNRFDSSTVRRHLARALQEAEEASANGSAREALDAAYGVLAGEGADDAPIGANLVILASAAPLGAELDALQARAHQGALEGITLTVIGAGARADVESLGALALSGQGRRRLVDDANRAAGVVQSELAASGRVVARAVRLRIRLARDVKLIKVLGSHPLDQGAAERVREVEHAVDLKVADTLGIQADRGEDEDGIQIVIPAYYAGDDHAILLDVMVPGPGKIADVRVRYKDLVNLRNAVARASLTLPSGRRSDNPLARNVRKNVLAALISQDLVEASKLVQTRRFADAERVVARSLTRIERIRERHPEFEDDPELSRDASMLAEYRRVLSGHGEWRDNREVRTHLADSLAYAGRVKLPPGAPH